VLGQLKEKWYHSTNGTDFRRETIYTNNIRGWQTEAKTVFKKNANDGTQLTNYFTSRLSYGDVNLTNGNISKMVWAREGETFKGLNFIYDGTNRMTYSLPEGGYTDWEALEYDNNGNITNLTRSGSIVDQLIYTRIGNQLEKVTDYSGVSTGFTAGPKIYTFDPNGNVTYDGNKAATITYNLNNLPKAVNLSGTPSTALVYDYDASGIKHKYTSSVTLGTTTTVSNVRYEGGFEYDKDKNFQRLSLAEGQAVLSNNSIRFNYYIKDHLGNVRMVFDEGASTLQKTDYYPFGLEIDRNSPVQTPAARNAVNRYTFLGRESQIGTGYMDLQARFYDPATGRFMQVDPMAQKREWLSSYNYGQNNPLIRVDPTGTLDEPWYKRVWNTVQSVAASASFTLVKSEQVRNDYKDKVSKLDPTDSKGRTQIKMDAREQTPAVMKAVAEEMRPINKEASRVAGTASKTNAGVNSMVENLGKAGKVAGGLAVGISVYNVVTSDNIPKAATHEIGTLGGAIAGGEGGAAAGAAIGVWFAGAGAMPGAIIGGIVGSIAGGISGGIVADKVYEKTTKQD
jgi:RHS repeat-associated protein